MRRALVEVATRLLDQDSRVVVLLGDIGVFGFRHAATAHSSRVLNVGILEQSMVGMGAGLSMNGFIPIIHTIAPFMVERALEQLKIDFAYQEVCGNVVTVGASFDYAALGATHHSPGDVGVMLSVPSVEIFVPGTSAEFAALLSATYDNDKLSYFRLSETENTDSQLVEPGIANVIRRGSGPLVVAVGPVLDIVLSAIDELDVSLVYVTSIRPFDSHAILELATHSTLVVVEPFYEGTTAIQLTDILRQRRLQIESIGIPRRFLRNYGTAAQHLEAIGMTPTAIRERLLQLL